MRATLSRESPLGSTEGGRRGSLFWANKSGSVRVAAQCRQGRERKRKRRIGETEAINCRRGEWRAAWDRFAKKVNTLRFKMCKIKWWCQKRGEANNFEALFQRHSAPNKSGLRTIPQQKHTKRPPSLTAQTKRRYFDGFLPIFFQHQFFFFDAEKKKVKCTFHLLSYGKDSAGDDRMFTSQSKKHHPPTRCSDDIMNRPQLRQLCEKQMGTLT